MNRWFGTIASISALASFALMGCNPPAEPTKEGGSTTGTTGETKTDDPTNTKGAGNDTGQTGSSSGAPEASTTPSAASDKPKNGDDVAVLDTSAGKIVVMFYPDKAPMHVENFKNLAKKGFYNGTRFHRCMPGFMIQGGDPQSKDLSKSGLWGTGGNKDASGKELNVNAEFNDVKHTRGILSMARSAPR